MVSLIRMAVVGAGNRGSLYGELANLHPREIEVVAVAEPIKARRDAFVEKHPQLEVFKTWADMFAAKVDCDVVFITTQDQQHYLPAMAALELGYHVVVEKPLSPSYQECERMIAKAKEKNRLLMLCYVLRYTPFFQKIKQIIQQKEIGDVKHVSIEMDVAYWHQAHSFVRGNWGNSAESSPMLLAKSCHDLDIFSYLIEKEPMQVSSFGNLTYFTRENAPIGSALRCTDGCQVEEQCPFSAKKIYLSDNIGWPVSTISEDLSYKSRKIALETGPYGRCVFHCDNDVVDHQVVNVLYEQGITATLTMSGFTNDLTRQVRILGTKGELNGNMNKNELTFCQFGQSTRVIDLDVSQNGMHAGGDDGLINALIQLMNQFPNLDQEAYYHDLLLSHFLCHQAETSRLTNETVQVTKFQHT
jgi:predicted dehydrogenase